MSKPRVGRITFGNDPRSAADIQRDTLARLERDIVQFGRTAIVVREVPSPDAIRRLLRNLEDVLIPLWKGETVTPAHRTMARGLWEQVADMQDLLKC